MKLQKKDPSEPAKWMENGIAACGKARAAFQLTLSQMVDAGYFFIRARASLDPETPVSDFFEQFKAKIAPRTIYKYIALTEKVFADCAKKNPAIAGNNVKLFAACKKLRLESPVEFVAVCRAEDLMRPFGEYDSVKYATKKLPSSEQLEFGFDVVMESTKVIKSFDLDTFFATMPEGTDQRQAVGETVAALHAAEQRLTAWLADFAEDESAANPSVSSVKSVAEKS